MDEQIAEAAESETATVTAQEESAPQAESQQAERTDWEGHAKLWEGRAKANEKALRDMERKVAEANEALAKARADAEKASAEASALAAKARRASLVKEAARESGVDADILEAMAGDDAESIAANAELLRSRMAAVPKYLSVSDGGGAGAAAVSRESIMAEPDPAKRLDAISRNQDLYFVRTSTRDATGGQRLVRARVLYASIRAPTRGTTLSVARTATRFPFQSARPRGARRKSWSLRSPLC